MSDTENVAPGFVPPQPLTPSNVPSNVNVPSNMPPGMPPAPGTPYVPAPPAPPAHPSKTAKELAAEALVTAEDKERTDAAAKAKAAHLFPYIGGIAANTMHPFGPTGNDGVPIVRDGVLTIALVTTINPGMSPNCVATLPKNSEIGDVVEVYTISVDSGPGAALMPAVGNSIGNLPVSTGDNFGTGVEVKPDSGKQFRKVSATNWQMLGA